MFRHFGLLQEQFLPDGWKVLVTCIFLNCTTRTQVEKVIDEFFDRWPDPEALLSTDVDEVKGIISSLGFKNRRYNNLINMSDGYLSVHFRDPRELHGIGEYAARCHEMLVENKLGEKAPKDHALFNYFHWRTEGRGDPTRSAEFDGRACPCKTCEEA